VDWKIQQSGIFVEKYPATLGTDVAGVVEEVGEGVAAFKKGDKVWVLIHVSSTGNAHFSESLHEGFYANDKAGFQQYTIVPAEIVAKASLWFSQHELASHTLVPDTWQYIFWRSSFCSTLSLHCSRWPLWSPKRQQWGRPDPSVGAQRRR
jgi:NADPH:quinone reductase-like Zn-dependent oxidoreductase